MPTSDLIVIGGGIVGLATAYKYQRRFPGRNCLLLEKEPELAAHQTGRNSGVLHSGIYYKPGSLKAKNCREGKLAMEEFCRAEGVPFDVCGKVIVALSEAEFLPYKKRIQIIFQNPYASLNPRFTVGQIICEPMVIHGIGENSDARAKMAFELLAKVGLPEMSFYKYPHEFSGGQRQRIAIARCLTMKPDILICDESVSALDVSVQAQVLNLLQDLQDRAANGVERRRRTCLSSDYFNDMQSETAMHDAGQNANFRVSK